MTLADNGFHLTSEYLECNEQVIETFFPFLKLGKCCHYEKSCIKYSLFVFQT